MKNIILILAIALSIFADEFDLIDTSNQKKVLYPMTQKEIRKYIPLIPRMLTKKRIRRKSQKRC